MRKVKKFMALGAAAVMAASMLAGCGGSGSAATEAQKENAAPVSAEAEKEKSLLVKRHQQRWRKSIWYSVISMQRLIPGIRWLRNSKN